MSAAAKVTDVDDLVQQLADVRVQLETRKASLLEQVEAINRALGFEATKATASTGKSRKAGIGEAVVQFVKLRPGSTLKEIKAAFPDHPPSSVESTVRNLASGGKLTKDDQTPRHFSAPADSSELSPTPARSPEQAKPNGAARPQQGPSPKG